MRTHASLRRRARCQAWPGAQCGDRPRATFQRRTGDPAVRAAVLGVVAASAARATVPVDVLLVGRRHLGLFSEQALGALHVGLVVDARVAFCVRRPTTNRARAQASKCAPHALTLGAKNGAYQGTTTPRTGGTCPWWSSEDDAPPTGPGKCRPAPPGTQNGAMAACTRAEWPAPHILHAMRRPRTGAMRFMRPLTPRARRPCGHTMSSTAAGASALAAAAAAPSPAAAAGGDAGRVGAVPAPGDAGAGPTAARGGGGGWRVIHASKTAVSASGDGS